MEYYALVKAVHISAVSISITLFISRVYWLLARPELLKNRILKYLPHIVDAVLLFSALLLLLASNIYPGTENPWLIAKIIAMLLYILSGMFLFRVAKGRITILYTLILSILIYLYIVHTAIFKTINPFIF